MSQGLRVWDANYNLTLDISDFLLKVVALGIFTVGAGSTVGVPVSVADSAWRYRAYFTEVDGSNNFKNLLILPHSFDYGSGIITVDNTGSSVAYRFRAFVVGA